MNCYHCYLLKPGVAPSPGGEPHLPAARPRPALSGPGASTKPTGLDTLPPPPGPRVLLSVLPSPALGSCPHLPGALPLSAGAPPWGPVFLMATFPASDTRPVPGPRERGHGCRAAPAQAGRDRVPPLGRGAGLPPVRRAGPVSPGATTRPSAFPSPQRKGEVNKPITLGNEAK